MFYRKEKKMLVIFYKNRFDHTNPLFCEHNLLKVPDKIALQTCIFVFKSIYIYPDNTTYESLSHNVISTRRPNDHRIPFCRTVHAQRSVSVRGVRESRPCSDVFCDSIPYYYVICWEQWITFRFISVNVIRNFI